MTAQIIDGKAIAERLLTSIKTKVDARISSGKRAPCLAVVLVGADPASAIYVRNKRKACEKVGIRSVAHDLPASTSAFSQWRCIRTSSVSKLLLSIHALNGDMLGPVCRQNKYTSLIKSFLPTTTPPNTRPCPSIHLVAE